MTMVEANLATDEEVIQSFPLHQGPSVPGFIVDFLGTKTRVAYIAETNNDAFSGQVEGYPVGEGNFHSTGMEWAGSLRAVLEATKQLVVVELGAGWGPWLVALARAAQLRGISDCRLVGVEGSKGHVEFMLSHFADNGLDPKAHTLLHAVIGPTDGVAEFPVLADPSANYGAQAIFARPAESAARSIPTERVRCVSLPTLLRPFAKVDVIHFDIQGAEAEVIGSAHDVLKEKVKMLVIGTHGRTIEQQLLEGLAARGWVLEAEKSCAYKQDGLAIHLDLDGCQVWRNPALYFPRYQPGQRIDLSDASSSAYLSSGWYAPEPWGRWASPAADVQFRLPRTEPLQLRLLATTYGEQPIIVRFDGREVTTFRGHGTVPELIEIDVPPDATAETNTLQFLSPQAKSPASVGGGHDDRVLGVGITWMELAPVR